jgi:hypothetical protein
MRCHVCGVSIEVTRVRSAIPVTCAIDRRCHRVTDDALAAARAVRSGRYTALCGHQVLATALVCPPGPACQGCAAVATPVAPSGADIGPAPEAGTETMPGEPGRGPLGAIVPKIPGRPGVTPAGPAGPPCAAGLESAHRSLRRRLPVHLHLVAVWVPHLEGDVRRLVVTFGDADPACLHAGERATDGLWVGEPEAEVQEGRQWADVLAAMEGEVEAVRIADDNSTVVVSSSSCGVETEVLLVEVPAALLVTDGQAEVHQVHDDSLQSPGRNRNGRD